YTQDNDVGLLMRWVGGLEPPIVTGSYIITGKPGYPKAQGVVQYIHQWCQRDWEELWTLMDDKLMSLRMLYEALDGEGLGTFMTAQLIADLKYLPCMKAAPDWWSWAAPGPGSKRGLNIVLGREMDTPWLKDEWLMELNRLSSTVTPKLKEMGLEQLH